MGKNVLESYFLLLLQKDESTRNYQIVKSTKNEINDSIVSMRGEAA